MCARLSPSFWRLTSIRHHQATRCLMTYFWKRCRLCPINMHISTFGYLIKERPFWCYSLVCEGRPLLPFYHFFYCFWGVSGQHLWYNTSLVRLKLVLLKGPFGNVVFLWVFAGPSSARKTAIHACTQWPPTLWWNTFPNSWTGNAYFCIHKICGSY